MEEISQQKENLDSNLRQPKKLPILGLKVLYEGQSQSDEESARRKPEEQKVTMTEPAEQLSRFFEDRQKHRS